jgi:uncharacterized protein (DUF1697 family)
MQGKPKSSRIRNPAKDGRQGLGHYLALLRGINVGGRNVIKMAELRACVEDLGCLDVKTFIQSGNVIFRSKETRPACLVIPLERALSKQFGYESRVVVLMQTQLARIVERAPAGFGQSPAEFKYDVIFLREPLTAAEALKSVSFKQGVDAAHKGAGVLYFSRRVAKLTQSQLSKIVMLPVYQDMTIRNWNTTTRLLALMKKSFSGETR